MILPTKHGDVDRSLIVLGAHLLDRLQTPRELATLWEEIRSTGLAHSFNRFYEAVILLRILGAVEASGSEIYRVPPT